MGILNTIIGTVLSNSGVIDQSIQLLDKASDKLEERSQKKYKALFECKKGEKALVFIQQDIYQWKDKLYIYDVYQNIRYTMIGKLISMKYHYTVLNANGEEIGDIKEKLFSRKLSTLFEIRPRDVEIKLHGKLVATMHTKLRIGKQKYTLDNGLQIKGNIVGWKYQITRQGEVIARIQTKRLQFLENSYLITMREEEEEALILMIVMALDLLKRKDHKEEVKETFGYRNRKWMRWLKW